MDFTEPPGYGSYNPWDEPTPNESVIEVIGADTTWTTGVYESILGFFKAKGKTRGWFHTPTAFTLLNWLIGLPASLWKRGRYPLLLGDWSAWLAEGDEPEQLIVILRKIDNGLPCGSERFLKKLEKQAGRVLQYRPQGRPRSNIKG